MQYFFFINRTLDAKLLIYSDRVADGKEHKECNYYPPAFLPPMQVTISAFLRQCGEPPLQIPDEWNVEYEDEG